MQIVCAVIAVPIFLILNEGYGFGYIQSFLLAMVIALAIMAVGGVMLDINEERTLREAQERLKVALTETIRAHFGAHPDHVRVLRQIYDRTVYKDDFGDLQRDDWWDKLEEYAKEKIGFGNVSHAEMTALWQELRALWQQPTASHQATGADGQQTLAYSLKQIEEHVRASTGAPATGREYEHACFDRLAAAGFQVRLTPATGDQGADIIARKGQFSIAIQCKHHSEPVGNRAVQEAEAARQFYDCTYAVVVTDSGYTKSARQLANKIGVTLLSTEQLSRLRMLMLSLPRSSDQPSF